MFSGTFTSYKIKKMSECILVKGKAFGLSWEEQ